MVALTDQDAEPITAGVIMLPTIRRIGLLPSASMIAGATIAMVWLWLPIMIGSVGTLSIPSVIGFTLSSIPPVLAWLLAVSGPTNVTAVLPCAS